MNVEDIKSHLQEGSWECCGAGEISCPVYFIHPVTGEEVEVARLSGDNGANRLFNPEGEAWVESINDLSDEVLTEIYQEHLKDAFEWYLEIRDKRAARALNRPGDVLAGNRDRFRPPARRRRRKL